MADSRKRIAGAFLIGSALVAGAFLISRQSAAQTQEGTVVVAPARSHIAVADSDGDGVPDWRDALQKTQSIQLQVASTTYEEPTTITGKFAINFLEDLLRSKTYGQFGASTDELVSEATNKLIKSSQDVLFREEDISIISQDDDFILHAYGNHIAAIILSQTTSGENEAVILQDALRYNDPARLQKLEPIAASYADMVKQALEAPVPEKFVVHHLNLLNALNAVREDVGSMQKVYDDPLYTLVRMKRYQDDVLGLYNAIIHLYAALETRGNITYMEGDPAYAVIQMLENI